MSELKNRYDFVLFFDVQDGNPNGDPDAGNMPRMDNDTGLGLVTDVCLKRKVRNYIQLAKPDIDGLDIFVKEKAVLNRLIEEAHNSNEVTESTDKTEAARKWMCKKYFDIRTFGAVMTTGNKDTTENNDDGKKDKSKKKEKVKNAGQVRGPVQMTFARSLDRINFIEHTITRMAVTNEKDEEKERTMGNKFTVPYGLYRAHGFVSPQLAAQTGFSEEDLDLFFKALVNMFEYDRSAARGMMATRKLIVFKHDTPLGNAPAWKLFELVHAQKKQEVSAPRSYQDYELTIDKASCPEGVTIIEK